MSCTPLNVRKRHPFDTLFVDKNVITEHLKDAMVRLLIPHFIGHAFHWTHNFVRPIESTLRILGAFSGFPYFVSLSF